MCDEMVDFPKFGHIYIYTYVIIMMTVLLYLLMLLHFLIW